MKCIPVKELNAKAAEAGALVLEAENLYADQISKAAQRIYRERRERPIVLISGPSGSGKTTTAGRIQRLLEDNGCRAHTISMDNYFLPLTEQEKQLAEQGCSILNPRGGLIPSFSRLTWRSSAGAVK